MEADFAHVLLEHSPDALLLLDPDGTISFLNLAAEQLFGYPRARLLGADSGLLLAETGREAFRAVLTGVGATAAQASRALTASGVRALTASGVRADGTELLIEITCSLVPAGPKSDPHRQPVALSVRGVSHPDSAPTDVPQNDAGTAAGSAAAPDAAAHRRRTAAAAASSPSGTAASAEHDDQLKAGVLRDPLTALPNGTLFNERLAGALRRGDPVDILLLDLADVTDLNNTPGCSGADELLVEVARRLRNCVRPQDTVARLGGNEFGVMLTECFNADAVAARVAAAVQEPLLVGGTLARPGVSMGLASRTGRTADGAELLRQADAAMTAAKSVGPGTWLRFLPVMLDTAAHRADGGTGLRHAVELGQVSVHYQPVVSPSLGSVVQFEALVRWERYGRLIPPHLFLPAAEQSGLIREIGDEVLRQACVEIRPWLAGDPAYSVAVNVSGLQFQHGGFATDVLSIVASTGVDPRQLMLELAESVFFNAGSDVLSQLRQLREAGVRIAMDDFGTGYSSLGRLKELPLDAVKIDRSCVAMIKTGQERLPFFGTVITAAHALNLSVTAEGIEMPAQAKYLMDLGCDSLQGYLFAKPAPARGLAVTMESALNAIDRVEGLC